MSLRNHSRFFDHLKRLLAHRGYRFVGSDFGRTAGGLRFHKITAMTDDEVVTHKIDVPGEVEAFSQEMAERVARVFGPCCQTMRDHLAYRCCEEHGEHSPDRVVLKSALPEGEGRYLLVGQNAAWDFEFCPWCGSRFQHSDSEEPGTRQLLKTSCIQIDIPNSKEAP